MMKDMRNTGMSCAVSEMMKRTAWRGNGLSNDSQFLGDIPEHRRDALRIS